MIYKIKKFSKFSNILKSIGAIISNDTSKQVPKPASSCSVHIRQYSTNFLITSRGLWLPLPCWFFGVPPQTYSKSFYSGYINVPNPALLIASFPK